MQYPLSHALAGSLVLAASASCNGGGGVEGSLGGGTQSTSETGTSTSGDGDGDPGITFEAVSILLVVDNSGSMGRAQWSLAQRARDLLGPLDAAGIPWRLGITTTDAGNPWCTPDLTSPE